MTSFFVSYLLIVLNLLNANALPMNEFELPKTWTKDFTIRYSFSGSMDGSRTELTFSYDSCNYTIQAGMNSPKKGVFAMTETTRAEILKKMHALKVSKIKSEMQTAAVDDGWSESLSMGSHWIEGGTSAKMSDTDKEIFSAACGYLQDFVVKKKK
jgi:hypothetical protein